ncbi:unnamed protein product [Arctia plantaginis]|uniref:Alpha-galactosidase n=1 Tax=Arctia plantaginis TaxID=874455 RepID=A0A8S0Z124_ARCPL|nr:unnamed protein product [Arctia plantaginis]
MPCFRYPILIFIFIFSLNQVDLLENGVARTPPMGWMSWGYYMCSIKCERESDKCLNEQLIMSVADTFYNEGYQEAGYEYIIVDDCWAEKHRDEHGRLVPDKKRFPRGMKFLADYIHSKGLKFGMYTNLGPTTCMHFPASQGHFSIDAKTFAEWGIDYLKVDGCFIQENVLNEGYIDLGEFLRKTGRDIVYSCSWPYYIQFIYNKEPDLERVGRYCNLWRNYHDVMTSWTSIINVIDFYEMNYKQLSPYHGPGHWNDPDMLILGTGALTDSQSRVHLAVYAMMSAPLLLSCDMAKLTNYEKKILQNLDLIAIAQDTLGIMAEPHTLGSGVTLWVKPHEPRKGNKYPSFSFAYVNMAIFEKEILSTPLIYGLNSSDSYTIYDVFSGSYIKNITRDERIKVTVPGHDVVLYTFYPL